MTLRVLHVLDVLQPSGAETCLRVAGPLWAGEGVSCDVLATGSELGPYARALHDAGYRTGHLPLADPRRLAMVLPRLVRREGYDVVHTHIEGGGFHVDLLARWGGARAVQHVHNVFAFEGPLRVERIVQRAVLRAMGVPFLGVSQDVVDNERDRFRNTATLFLNWADTETYRPPSPAQRRAAREALDLPADVPVAVSVANCHDFKNHLTMVEAMVDLPDVVWLHVGGGTLERQEQALAEELDVADRIRFLGQREPLTALHAADVFVMNSWYEGQGISAIEALSAGLPAVLSDVDGLRNLRDMGVPAAWCGTDAATLSDTIRGVISQPPMGTLERMREIFSPTTRVPALADVYRRVARS